MNSWCKYVYIYLTDTDAFHDNQCCNWYTLTFLFDLRYEGVTTQTVQNSTLYFKYVYIPIQTQVMFTMKLQ